MASSPLQPEHWVKLGTAGRDFSLKTSAVAKDGESGYLFIFFNSIGIIGDYGHLVVPFQLEIIIMCRTDT